jgi:hypothetical protein
MSATPAVVVHAAVMLLLLLLLDDVLLLEYSTLPKFPSSNPGFLVYQMHAAEAHPLELLTQFA